jgi:hypothetical protein
MDRERNEDGQYVETLIDVFRAVYEGPHIMTTKEVADNLNCSREAARQRLLEDERIKRKEVANGVVWWVESPWPTSPDGKENQHQRKRRQQRAGKEAVPGLIEHLRENGPAQSDELKQVAWRNGGGVFIEDKDTLWDAAKGPLTNHQAVSKGGFGPWRAR